MLAHVFQYFVGSIVSGLQNRFGRYSQWVDQSLIFKTNCITFELPLESKNVNYCKPVDALFQYPLRADELTCPLTDVVYQSEQSTEE